MMKKYERPVIIVNSDLAEGVYAASGSTAGDATNNRPGCDSKYMNGVWQNQDYSQWPTTYKQQQGCNGCPAYRANGCGLQVDQAYLEGATSYNVDNGNRMPGWERDGHLPDDPVTY